jgi:hypothetical protein
MVDAPSKAALPSGLLHIRGPDGLITVDAASLGESPVIRKLLGHGDASSHTPILVADGVFAAVALMATLPRTLGELICWCHAGDFLCVDLSPQRIMCALLEACATHLWLPRASPRGIWKRIQSRSSILAALQRQDLTAARDESSTVPQGQKRKVEELEAEAPDDEQLIVALEVVFQQVEVWKSASSTPAHPLWQACDDVLRSCAILLSLRCVLKSLSISAFLQSSRFP